MKNLIYLILVAFTISSCKKSNIETIESIIGTYTYKYSFTRVSNEYDMNSGMYNIKNETGTDTKQIEIRTSPNSDKELIIVNLLNQDETTIYFSDGLSSFKIISNSEYNVDANGGGTKKGEELHFNVEFDSPFVISKFEGIAIRD